MRSLPYRVSNRKKTCLNPNIKLNFNYINDEIFVVKKKMTEIPKCKIQSIRTGESMTTKADNIITKNIILQY